MKKFYVAFIIMIKKIIYNVIRVKERKQLSFFLEKKLFFITLFIYNIK